MKPIKLVMQAFGPYAGKEVVDFEALSKAGMFIIKGPTGSGKTTIYDGMSIALYGKSTGEDDGFKGGRNDFDVWRCNQADWETETILEFTFAANNKLYRFTRRLVPKKKKLDVVFDVSIMDEAGVFQPIFENPKEKDLSAKAEEIIGLNGSQFKQVVLLPQGKFERFLIADSNEKEQILARLFGSEQWKGYADRFYDSAKALKDKLDTARSEITASLNEENVPFESVESVHDYVNLLDEKLLELDKSHAAFDVEKKQKELDADIAMAVRFDALHKSEHKVEVLISREEKANEARARLEKARKAEALRNPLKDEAAYKAETEKRNAAYDELNKLTEKYDRELKLSKEYLDSFVSAPVTEECNKVLGELKAKAPIYEKMDELSAKLKSAKANLEMAEKKCASQKQNLEKAVQVTTSLLKAYNESNVNEINLRNRYYSGIYGEIAAELVEGKACPVCGSTSHPCPAERCEGSVSKEMVDSAEKMAADAKSKWEEAENNRRLCDERLNAEKENLSKAMVSFEAAKTACDEASHNMIKNINSLEQLNETILEINKKINSYESKKKELTEIYEAAQKKVAAHKSNIETAAIEKKDAAEKYVHCCELLKDALEKAGYSDVNAARADMMTGDEQLKLSDEITRYDTQLKENKENVIKQRSELEGISEPDVNGFDMRKKSIENEIKTYSQEKARIISDKERLKKKYDILAKKQSFYNANIQQAESDFAFAKKLRGDTGIGLQRYVLGIMFNQIIVEANRMLEKVHNGRFQLFRTDEKGSGNKRGLELLAHDNRRPEEKGRPVSSLSGGEKFLVSLALSIGMSAIAQKSGLHIEALFIDEGFGTLDESSIDDALEVLKSVQKSNGMIGIISHVKLLMSTIPTHLEIVKTENGSNIKLS